MMKKKKRANENGGDRRLNKRGMILIIVLAALIVLISVASASYSWFSPLSKDGIGMQFQQSNYIRSENCELTFFDGVADSTGAIEYNTAVTEFAVTKASNTSDPTSGLHYYRITVTNNDEDNGSNVSLLFDGTISAGTTIGVVAPSNSVHTYAANTTGVFLVRNAYVSPKDTSKTGAGVLNIDFFLRYTGSSASTSIYTSNVKILYN